MGYVNLFINWKNQDLEKIKNQLSESLKATFILNGDREVIYNYSQIVNLLEKRFETEQDWTFDVLKKFLRNDEQVVLVNIIREGIDYTLIEPLSVCLLTFKDNKLIKIHMETNLNST